MSYYICYESINHRSLKLCRPQIMRFDKKKYKVTMHTKWQFVLCQIKYLFFKGRNFSQYSMYLTLNVGETPFLLLSPIFSLQICQHLLSYGSYICVCFPFIHILYLLLFTFQLYAFILTNSSELSLPDIKNY